MKIVFNLKNMQILRSYNPILFTTFWQDRFVRLNFLVSFSVNLILWLLLIWQVRNTTSLIPLHYNIYFGIDLFGPWYQFFLMPGLGLIYLLINITLGYFIYHREKILSFFLLGASTFCQFILLVAGISIILVNNF
jgi:hypothetical protein